jgi:hypothetical protein
MVSMGLAWLLLVLYQSGHKNKDVMPEEDYSRLGEPLMPSKGEESTDYEQSPAVKWEQQQEFKIKEESMEQETLVDILRHGGDADDEHDSDDAWKETGAAGTNFEDGAGGSLRRRPSRGGTP